MEIKFRNTSYIYNDKTPLRKVALTNVNLSVKEGLINGIIGKSGSGKTTLIEMINALILPTSGSVLVGRFLLERNKRFVHINRLRFEVGLVFQYPEEQFFCPTVKKEIAFGMKYFSYQLDRQDKRILDALKMVGLDETYLERDPFSLSSGEMRKVAIASVLAFNPKVLILDEPTIGLDSASKNSLIKLLKMLKNRYHKTIIVVTHDTDFLHRIADHIFVMKQGMLVFEGNKYDVFTNPSLEDWGVVAPHIVTFEMMTLQKKGIKLGYRDDINDLIKDVYRYVK